MHLITKLQNARRKSDRVQREIGKFTIIVGDFIFPFTRTVRNSRQKISKNMKDLNKAISHLDLNNIYKPLLPATEHPHCPNVLELKYVSSFTVLLVTKQDSKNLKGLKTKYIFRSQ